MHGLEVHRSFLSCALAGQEAFNHAISFLDLKWRKQSVIFNTTADETHNAHCHRPLLLSSRAVRGSCMAWWAWIDKSVVAITTNDCERCSVLHVGLQPLCFVPAIVWRPVVMSKGLLDQTSWLSKKWEWSPHRNLRITTSLWIDCLSKSRTKERRLLWISWSVFNSQIKKSPPMEFLSLNPKKAKTTGIKLVIKTRPSPDARSMTIRSLHAWSVALSSNKKAPHN